MYIVTGGTGHIGSVVAKYLLDRQEKVTIVTRKPQKAGQLFDHRAAEAEIDMHDVDGLHRLFSKAEKVFLLNPHAATSADTDAEERKTARAMSEALRDTAVTKIVLESTALAQKGTYIGDLGVLFELEEMVAGLGIPKTVLRPGYYMTNWLSAIQETDSGLLLTSFYPADLKIAMVAPVDVGVLAGSYLLADKSPAIVNIEGPERYSPSDVAHTLSNVLRKNVRLRVIPPERWKSTYISIGFSEAAATSYSKMNEIALNNKFAMPNDTMKGQTTLETFFRSQMAHLPAPALP